MKTFDIDWEQMTSCENKQQLQINKTTQTHDTAAAAAANRRSIHNDKI